MSLASASVCLISTTALSVSLIEIVREYDFAHYGETISLARRFIEEGASAGDEAEARRLTAFSYVALGLNDDALEEFQSILRMKPDFELDPVRTSPKIATIFEQAREDVKHEHAADTMRDEKRVAAAWSALFPGLGQIYKGQKGKGYIMAASQIMLIAGTIYSHIEYDRAHQDYLRSADPEEIERSYEDYNRWHRARVMFGGAAIALWAYSHIDAALSSTSDGGGEGNSLHLLIQPGANTISIHLSISAR